MWQLSKYRRLRHQSSAFLLFAFSVAGPLRGTIADETAQGQATQQKVVPVSPGVAGSRARIDTKGVVVGDVANALSDLKIIHSYINLFRADNDGRYPSRGSELLGLVSNNPVYKDREGVRDALSILTNPDSRYADSHFLRSNPEFTIAYVFYKIRKDGSLVGGPKFPGTRDAVASTSIYYFTNNKVSAGRVMDNPAGFYVVLWDDGQVEKVPYDQLLYSPVEGDKGVTVAFPYQAGVPVDAMTYAERWTANNRSEVVPLGKPLAEGKDIPVPDNGGPESLLSLSRLLSFPSRYGIEREELWKYFKPAQEEFTLADVQGGATKLKLPLDLKTFSLDELQKLKSPAIFLTSDDKRLVVISQIDDKEAIVIDRGMTHIVARDLLAKRYDGQALVVSSAATRAQAPQALVEDPVRQVFITSPEQGVSQLVKISNTGSASLKLQIERPIPGCENADLSSDTIAPGNSATLTLSLRWRSLLKSPTQNVVVYLSTNDPGQPRLPLGFKLALPATP